MKTLYIGFFIAFIAILLKSPFMALIFGSAYNLLFKLPENFIGKSIGTYFLQIGIIIIGLTMSASDAMNITIKYFPYISIFVVSIFCLGIFISRVFKLDKKLGILIASGTAICGATAIAAISPLIKSGPKNLIVSLAIIFIFNAFAILIFPFIGNGLDMNYESFGAWISMAIHDTSSVMGAAISYGEGSVETAATLKMGRTIWLIPLMLIIGIFYKDKASKKVKFPFFILIFILAVIAGSTLELKDSSLLFLKSLSNIFLVAALFCIGAQINYKSIQSINTRIFSAALILWIFAAMFSYLLVNLNLF